MQGFNMGRYHPPDSLDRALADKPAPGFNRQKNGSSTQSTGTPTVRFEMPFAIWCTTCKPAAIIGQGVRFNAQKTKVGNYYSTPIWGFRMRHGACASIIEIRTDPQAGDYVVHEGARRRDYGDEQHQEQQTLLGEVVTEAEKAKRAADPFASLEGRIDQKEKAKKEGWWVEKIQDHKKRDWDDVWSANRRLRQSFRVEKKELEHKERNREELADRFGLHIDVLDETVEDVQRAALMRYGESEKSNERKVIMTTARPLFGANETSNKLSIPEPSTRARKKAVISKALLKNSINGNTRIGIDPFLNDSSKSDSKGTFLPGLKRKRDTAELDTTGEDEVKDAASVRPAATGAPKQGPLIAYHSETSSDND